MRSLIVSIYALEVDPQPDSMYNGVMKSQNSIADKRVPNLPILKKRFKNTAASYKVGNILFKI